MIVEIPALIDMHTHLRDFLQSDKETFETGTLAALAGGFGAVCNMPNSNPACDNVEVLAEAQSKKANCKVYQVVAVTRGLKSLELVDFKRLKQACAIAFSNDGYVIPDVVFEDALMSGELILSHLEDEISDLKFQLDVFKKLVERGFSPRLHFCHISKGESVELIRRAKRDGYRVTCETCPHYFTFTKDDIGENGVLKMNPPLGDDEDRKAIIEGVLDNTIDVIATDHAPHTQHEKLCNYKEALNGIIGLETAFSLTFERFGLEVVVQKMASAPKEILRIENNKKIKVDTELEWVYSAQNSKSKCRVSPYDNMKMIGKVVEYAI